MILDYNTQLMHERIQPPSHIIFEPRVPFVPRFRLNSDYRANLVQKDLQSKSYVYDRTTFFLINYFEIQKPPFLETIDIKKRENLRKWGGISEILCVNKVIRHINTLIPDLGEFDYQRQKAILDQTKEAITSYDYASRSSSRECKPYVCVNDPNTQFTMLFSVNGEWDSTCREFTLNSLVMESVFDNDEDLDIYLCRLRKNANEIILSPKQVKIPLAA